MILQVSFTLLLYVFSLYIGPEPDAVRARCPSWALKNRERFQAAGVTARRRYRRESKSP